MTDAEKDRALVARHLNELMEHFDAVQIFVTRRGDAQDSTLNLTQGAGNIFARQGQVRAWSLEQDEYSRSAARE